MSEVKKHEWPAFPQHADWQTDMDAFINNPGKYGAPTMHGAGITMRDYFAAKALQGMIADSNVKATVHEFAETAYKIADAMLEARDKP